MPIPSLDAGSARSRTAAPEVPPEPGTEEQAPAVIQAECAFLVYREPDGRTTVTADLNAPIVARRPPSTHDVVGMCANATDDVRAQAQTPALAQAVVGQMVAMQQAMEAKMQEVQVLQQMQKNGRPGG